MSKQDDDVGTADTHPELASRRVRKPMTDDPPAGLSLPEVWRALKYVEADARDCLYAMTGKPDDKNDTGLKGEVKEIRTLLRVVLVILLIGILPLGLRALDGTGRDWGLWSPPAKAQAQR